MITIPVIRTATPEGDVLSPAQPIPANAAAVVCDGDTYTVYQPGDELPPAPAGE